jgi:UDP:flavonoid glycosyltransferase YjiC (YdhE family)
LFRPCARILPAREPWTVRPRGVTELGLGACIPPPELTADTLREQADRLLNDADTKARLIEARDAMQADRGAQLAADLIGEYLTG